LNKENKVRSNKMDIHKNMLKMAQIDDLTGLPTKDQHKAQAAALLNLFHEKYKYAYVSCDIVDFKVFNEMLSMFICSLSSKYFPIFISLNILSTSLYLVFTQL